MSRHGRVRRLRVLEDHVRDARGGHRDVAGDWPRGGSDRQLAPAHVRALARPRPVCTSRAGRRSANVHVHTGDARQTPLALRHAGLVEIASIARAGARLSSTSASRPRYFSSLRAQRSTPTALLPSHGAIFMDAMNDANAIRRMPVRASHQFRLFSG